MPATPIPDPSPHDALLSAGRQYLLCSWRKRLMQIVAHFIDQTFTKIDDDQCGLPQRTPPPDMLTLVGKIDRTLFDAARAWGVWTRDEYPVRLTLITTSKFAVDLEVPRCFPGDADPEPDPPHQDDDAIPAWSFSDDELFATYRTKTFPCAGMKQKLLKALASPAGAEVPNAALIEAAWGARYGASDKQLRNLVTQLRDHLAESLQLAPDTKPVVACGGSHKLTLV